jgi:TetR/AcrR family transcriptional repressor of nem operon
MPYSPQHKQRTRDRILRSAANLFASRGFAATSIEQVMAAAGLTRGAFYAHFESKAALYAEAMRAAGERRLPADPRFAQGWLDEILDPLERAAPRDAVLSGPWAFLVADIANPDPRVRAAYASALRRLLKAAVSTQSTGTLGADAQRRAMQLAAMLVGGLALASTVDDAALRESVAVVCREFALDSGVKPALAAEPEMLWSTAEVSALH